MTITETIDDGDIVVDRNPEWLRLAVDEDDNVQRPDGDGLAHFSRAEVGEMLRHAQGDYVRLGRAFDASQAVALDLVRKADTLMADIRIIAVSLRDEAIRRDWCGEYGDWIAGVNSLMTQSWLQHCRTTETRRYIVNVEVAGRSGEHVADAVREIVNRIERADEELDTETEEVSITVTEA